MITKRNFILRGSCFCERDREVWIKQSNPLNLSNCFTIIAKYWVFIYEPHYDHNDLFFRYPLCELSQRTIFIIKGD